MRKTRLLAGITFLSAFLLFELEFIVCKLLLPRYGGSFMVWGASLVFFQAALLAGYAFAHALISRLGFYRYRFVPLLLFLLTGVFFPGRAFPGFAAASNTPLVIDIFIKLCILIGPVFFLLSTISITTQCWLTDTALPQRANPYTLYAASNLGSFGALVSYPFLIEPFLGLGAQLFAWRILYLALFILYAAGLYSIKTERSLPQSSPGAAPRHKSGNALRCVLYSCAGSIAFLSITNILAYEIAPGPFVWSLPLGIYLFSFFLVFKSRPFCPRFITERYGYAFGLSAFIFFITKTHTLPLLGMTLCYCAVVFWLCMFCHSRLYASRPQDTGLLTRFYLYIAVGGVLGGVFVNWIAPLCFRAAEEFLVGLLLIALAESLQARVKGVDWRLLRYFVYGSIALCILMLPFSRKLGELTLIILSMGFAFSFVHQQLAKDPRALSIWLFLFLVFVQIRGDTLSGWRAVNTRRNYYGIYKVIENNRVRILFNGSTVHGAQLLDKRLSREPTFYYHTGSPVGEVMESGVFSFKRIGMVGLGVGCFAAYGRHGQAIDFYELDPACYDIAANFFTYLKESKADLRFVFGDARITLRNTPAASYDLVIVDAFTGDAIPLHLLTKEALLEYRRVLTPEGVLLVHVSNRFFNIDRGLFATASLVQGNACFKSFSPTEEDKRQHRYGSDWVAVTWDKGVFKKMVYDLAWLVEGSKLAARRPRPWSDDYSTLLPIFDPAGFAISLPVY